MIDPTQRPQSHLFTVRIWTEPLKEGQVEWRGQLRHIPSGESLYFREWAMLIEQIKLILENKGRA